MSEDNQVTPSREIGWQATAINQAITDTGVAYKITNAELLEKFGREVTFSDDGIPHVLYDSEILPLQDALTRYSFDTDGVCDRRTLPRSGSGGGRPHTDSKSAYPTAADKAKVIAERGFDYWEKLPLENHSGKEVVCKEDFYRLPRHEKVRLTDKDPQFFLKLPSAPTRQTRGSFVNHEALAKQAKIRP